MNTKIVPTYLNFCVFSFFRLSALNVAWTDLSVSALNTLCTELPRSMQRINISGCRKTLTDDRMYLLFTYLLLSFSLSHKTGSKLKGKMIDIFKF
jgi:hypothetical protein